MKAIDFELIEEESRQNENRRFLSGITRFYPSVLSTSSLMIWVAYIFQEQNSLGSG